MSIKIEPDGKIFSFPVLRNEFKSIISIENFLKNYSYQKISKSLINFKFTFNLKSLLKVYKIFILFEKKLPTFSLLRVAELIGYYSRLQSQRFIKSKDQKKLIIITTESNPNGLASIAFARRNRLQSIFLSHGEPISPAIKHSLDLIILPGSNSRDFYKDSHIKNTLYYGYKEKYKKIKPIKDIRKLTYGLFLSKSMNSEGVAKITAQLEALGQKYFFRYHPNYKKNTKSLTEHINDADIILAGNTNVHLEVILHGKLSMYCKEIDSGPKDLNNYLTQGLIINWHKELSKQSISKHIEYLNNSEHIGKYLDLTNSYKSSIRAIENEIKKLISS